MEGRPVGDSKPDKKLEGNSVNDLLRQALLMLEQHNEERASTSSIGMVLLCKIFSVKVKYSFNFC